MQSSDEDKFAQLRTMIEDYTQKDVMVAFSGGVDSSLILRMACNSAVKSKSKVYAVTLHTMLHPVEEIENAKKVAEEVGALFLVMEVDELQKAGIINNPKDRCYLCKKYLFEQIRKKAQELQIDTIMDGTNEDDLHVYRPGIKALGELGIISPLAKTGITKVQVRQLALEYGVSVSKRPSAPCLATRFPYGTNLSYEKMRRVEQGEAYIKALGVYNIRLRVHDDIVRIEVDEQDMLLVFEHKKEIISYLKKLGYIYINIDLEGFRSGSMDYNLNKVDK